MIRIKHNEENILNSITSLTVLPPKRKIQGYLEGWLMYEGNRKIAGYVGVYKNKRNKQTTPGNEKEHRKPKLLVLCSGRIGIA